ncbi:PH domain-containing protein [Kytococcus aerolatus]|uniref:PH domain-containing protein n=1 Tax=Kytococcus aerolatus TaxID=592308 RepID=A0A212TZS0_9MICO|nr:PH domain-containing protein [Kytococcus aerolatus]SNC71381.1 PH domain-containing protein [Kytococcus aerolatus]
MTTTPQTPSTPPADPREGERQVVHPRRARILAVVSWLLAAVFLGLALTTDPISGVTIALALAGAALAWVLIWRPKVVLDPDALTVVNPVRTVRVPWQRVRRVGSRWSLEVETERGRHRAWAIGSSYRDPSGVDYSADVNGLGLLRRIQAKRLGVSYEELAARPAYEVAEDLQNVAGTVRGVRDAHADALADGVVEADQTPTVVRVDPLAAAALVTGLLVPLGLWLQALLD